MQRVVAISYVSGQPIGEDGQESKLFSLQDSTDWLTRNVGTKLPLFAA